MGSAKPPLGVLLLHGWNSSSRVFEHLAPALRAQGLPVHAPTYTGHGAASPEALRGVRWNAWRHDAAAALAALLEEADRAILVGHSMGGWLALHLAIDYRDRVDSAVIAGASLRTVSRLGPGRPLHFLAPWLPRLGATVRLRPRADSPAEPARLGHDVVPVDSVLQLFAFIKATRARLGRVTVPLLVLHGRRDATNAPTGAPALLAAVGTPAVDKRLQWLETADHQLFLGDARDEANRAVLAFIRARQAVLPAPIAPYVDS